MIVKALLQARFFSDRGCSLNKPLCIFAALN